MIWLQFTFQFDIISVRYLLICVLSTRWHSVPKSWNTYQARKLLLPLQPHTFQNRYDLNLSLSPHPSHKTSHLQDLAVTTVPPKQLSLFHKVANVTLSQYCPPHSLQQVAYVTRCVLYQNRSPRYSFDLLKILQDLYPLCPIPNRSPR
jgi:hypothetical protein